MLLLSRTFTMRVSDVASLVEYLPVVLGGESVTDRQTDDGCTDAQKINVALTHLYHEGKWCSKFGWIPPIGLGDYMMGRWMDDGWRTHGKILMLLSHILTMRGSDVASLVEFRPVVSLGDRHMDGGADGRTHRKVTLLSPRGREGEGGDFLYMA